MGKQSVSKITLICLKLDFRLEEASWRAADWLPSHNICHYDIGVKLPEGRALTGGSA